MRLARWSLVALLALLACAPAAGAATVSLELAYTVSDGKGSSDVWRLVYAAEPGETNRVTIAAGAGFDARVTDSGAPLTPGAHCTARDGGVACIHPVGRSGAVRAVRVDLGDEDDSLESIFSGGANAGAGDDRVTGRSLDVDGGPGGDRFEDVGRVLYSNRTAAVRVTPDGIANDGEVGEGDNVVGPYRAVTGGSGADELRGSTPDGLNIGDPAGTIDGGAGADTIVGTSGRDRLVGGDGNDLIDGLEGDDILIGAGGADVLRGSAGVDTVDYTAAASPLRVALDDSGGDGGPAELDDVRDDVENVDASFSRGSHTLIGSAAANRLSGGNEDDVIDGRGGDDSIDGGGGLNHLTGGPGADVIHAGFGVTPATIDAADGERDRVYCTSDGADRVELDPFDDARGCAPLVARAWRKYANVSRSGRTGLLVRCPRTAAVPCAGRISLRPNPFARRAGVGEFSDVAPGRHARVRVRLTAATMRTLERERKVTLPVTIVARRTAPASTNVNEGFELVRLRAPR